MPVSDLNLKTSDFIQALGRIHSEIVVPFASRDTMTVETMRIGMTRLIELEDFALQQWTALVTATGTASAARSALAVRFNDVPQNVDTELGAIVAALNTVYSTYNGLVPSAGAAEFTFDLANKAHVPVMVPTGALNTMKLAVEALGVALDNIRPE